MGKVSNQTGKDGIGKPKRLEASSISLKAKEVQITREGTIRVTGLSSGATHVIQLLVDQGDAPLPYNPPSVTPSGPVAGFDYQVGSNTENFNDGFANANPGFNAGSGPPNLDF
tara:strand:- start:1369 stop:1707 length:339 start_codon:yes stop_codon:yes gene_type:complete